MRIPARIIDLLQQRPNMSSNEIAEALNAKLATVKVTLHNMVKAQKLCREKVSKTEKTKAGPQNLYAYRVSEVKSDNANTQNG